MTPTKTTREAVVKEAKSAPAPAAGGSAAGTEIEIPVWYGGEYGPDIANVAEHAGISEEEVVKRHSAKPCHCYMIGFLPGFAYLGGMDESIATPPACKFRAQSSRAAASASPANRPGIYPIDSPGGWQLIGRTPLRLFTPEAGRPTLIEAGYEVRFVPVSEEEFKKIEAEVAAGVYKPVVKEAEAI